MMGQLTVIMGGLDDVVVDDVDINDTDVAGRRNRIRRLELRSYLCDDGGGRPVAANWVGQQ